MLYLLNDTYTVSVSVFLCVKLCQCWNEALDFDTLRFKDGPCTWRMFLFQFNLFRSHCSQSWVLNGLFALVTTCKSDLWLVWLWDPGAVHLNYYFFNYYVLFYITYILPIMIIINIKITFIIYLTFSEENMSGVWVMVMVETRHCYVGARILWVGIVSCLLWCFGWVLDELHAKWLHSEVLKFFVVLSVIYIWHTY